MIFNEKSAKIITINKNDKITVIENGETWYKVRYGNYVGWAKADCLTKINQQQETINTSNDAEYTKTQLLNTLSFDMALNKPSGLTLAQFEKIFANDKNDKKSILKDNAKYFYYAEKQYNIKQLITAIPRVILFSLLSVHFHICLPFIGISPFLSYVFSLSPLPVCY